MLEFGYHTFLHINNGGVECNISRFISETIENSYNDILTGTYTRPTQRCNFE